MLKQPVPGIGIMNYNYQSRPVPPEAWYNGVQLFEYDRNTDGKQHEDWRIWMEQTSFRAKHLHLDVV